MKLEAVGRANIACMSRRRCFASDTFSRVWRGRRKSTVRTRDKAQ